MDEVICLREWMRGQQSPVRMTLVCGVLTAVYFGAGKLGLQWAIAHPNITMVCPSTGVALAALLIFGYRVWPGVVAGTLLVHLTTGIGVQACLGIAAGNMLAALASAFLVNQFANGLRAFERPRDVLLFTLFSGLIASTISATIGVLSLGTAWNEFLRQCTTWWQGDAVAALIVAPPLLLWAKNPCLNWTIRKCSQTLVIVLVLLAVGLFVPAQERSHVLALAALPLLIWAAFTFGQRETATLALLLAGFTVWDMPRGPGPIAGIVSPESIAGLDAQMLQLAFLSLASVTGLLLAAVVAERNHVEAELREAQVQMECRVQERMAELSRTSEALRRDLLESAPDAMVIVDARGRIVLVNAQSEKMFGYARQEMLGKKVELLVPEPYREQHETQVQDYFKAPSARPMGVPLKLRGRRRNGHVFPAEISLSPFNTAEGMLVSSAIRDVTERQETEEKLRQAERLAAIGEMIAGLAHESRNALQQSQACLELLALKAHAWPEIAGLVADVQKAQDHLHYLYEEVRGYAAPIKLKRERTRLGQLLEETWQQLAVVRHGRQAHFVQERAASGQRPVALPSNDSSPDLECSVDSQALRHVFRNLLENSLQACSDPVEIKATWTEADLKGQAGLRLSLADNGPGLTAESRQKLFEPFYTTKLQGTGLGLAICRRIIEAHDGTITVAPDTPRGTEIVITLPRKG